MGAITQAMAAAARGFGAEIRTESPVAPSTCATGKRAASCWRTGAASRRRVVLSNADPKRTFLGLVAARELPDEFRRSIESIKMDGPCAKVNFVLSEEPAFLGMPPAFTKPQRALATLVPSLEFAERCYNVARTGEIPEELWVDCVVASNVDPSLAPEGRHVMTTFVQYVPYRLRNGRGRRRPHGTRSASSSATAS